MKAETAETADMDLTDLDRDLLALLEEGRCTQGYLTDETGEHRNKVYQRLQLLVAAGYVEKIHDPTALYELRRLPDEEEEGD